MSRKTVGMSRADYDSLHVGEFADEYPKNAAQAANELRVRGNDAKVDTLNYLIRQGVVDEAAEGPRSQPSWPKKRIDQAAKYMEENSWFNATGWSWKAEDIDPVSDYKANDEMRMSGEIPGHYAKVLFPGSPRRVAYFTIEQLRNGIEE